jgi:hypothetical protein
MDNPHSSFLLWTSDVAGSTDTRDHGDYEAGLAIALTGTTCMPQPASVSQSELTVCMNVYRELLDTSQALGTQIDPSDITDTDSKRRLQWLWEKLGKSGC